MYKFIIISILATLLLSGCGTSSKADEFLKNTEGKAQSLTTSRKTITESDSSSFQLLEQIANKQDTSDKNSTQITKINNYQNYSQVALDDAKTANKRIVLISFAEDCSNCKALESSINHALSRIPDDTIFLKINYDKDTDLKTKYKITEANTIIVLNPDASEKTRSTGGIYKIEKILYYLL